VAAVSTGSPDPDERPDGTYSKPSASRSAAPASGPKEWPAPAWRRTGPDHSRDAATTGERSGTSSITVRRVADPARPDDGGGRAGQPNFGDGQGSRPFRPGPAARHRPGGPASPGPDRAGFGREDGSQKGAPSPKDSGPEDRRRTGRSDGPRPGTEGSGPAAVGARGGRPRPERLHAAGGRARAGTAAGPDERPGPAGSGPGSLATERIGGPEPFVAHRSTEPNRGRIIQINQRSARFRNVPVKSP
jgi:hypothetical protein